MVETNDTLFVTLRRLVIESPLEAKRVFLTSFEADTSSVEKFLEQLAKPGEGRLRQMVANAVRAHPNKHRVLRHLLLWRETETDEFTRRAIEAALVDVDARQPDRLASVSRSIDLSRASETYRYVAERLRHKLRNRMMGLQVHAQELLEAVQSKSAEDVASAAAKMNDDVIYLGRMLEATDVDPEYFKQRAITLEDWLREMNQRYSTQFEPIALAFSGESRKAARILASDYLLETIFWNLWVNAQQTVGAECTITIHFRTTVSHIDVFVIDNGPGFPPQATELAFKQPFSSSRSFHRGRGLMEVEDAVERLGGTVMLEDVGSAEFRIKISLPRQTT